MKVLLRNPRREVEVDGCLSLYRRDAECVMVLNETASDVWRLADGTLAQPEIVALGREWKELL